jgi:hypothetical protein
MLRLWDINSEVHITAMFATINVEAHKTRFIEYYIRDYKPLP